MKNIIILALSCLNIVSAFAEDNIQVFGSPVSPYVRKVISVLEEKKINYDLHAILPTVLLNATNQPVPADFALASPLGKIPAIQDGEFSIADSAVIVAYLEAKSPKSSVYPNSPQLFAKALWYEKYADTVMGDVFPKILIEKIVKPLVLKLDTDEQAVSEALGKIPEILQYLEGELFKNAGTYLVADKLTIADIAVAHHFISLQISKVTLDLESYPNLSKYLERVLAHPSIMNATTKQ